MALYRCKIEMTYNGPLLNATSLRGYLFTPLATILSTKYGVKSRTTLTIRGNGYFVSMYFKYLDTKTRDTLVTYVFKVTVDIITSDLTMLVNLLEDFYGVFYAQNLQRYFTIEKVDMEQIGSEE